MTMNKIGPDGLRDDEREALLTPAYDLRQRDKWWAERLQEARAEYRALRADASLFIASEAALLAERGSPTPTCPHGVQTGTRGVWCAICEPDRERARAALSTEPKG